VKTAGSRWNAGPGQSSWQALELYNDHIICHLAVGLPKITNPELEGALCRRSSDTCAKQMIHMEHSAHCSNINMST
jgi:hypothetical protein